MTEKTFDYSVNFENFKITEEEMKVLNTQGHQIVFENIFTNAIMSLYPKGLKGPKQRSLGRIQNKLDLSKDNTIVLEQSEIDLLKEIFLSDDVEILPVQNRLFMIYQKKVEELIK